MKTLSRFFAVLAASSLTLAVAATARADGDPSGLSKYGKAVFQAIPADYSLKAQDVISYNNTLPADWMVLSPATDTLAGAANTWGKFGLADNHSAAIPARMKALISSGATYVDILTLGGGDSPGNFGSEGFRKSLIEALQALNAKEQAVTVRILLGAVKKGDNLTEEFLAALRPVLAGLKKVKVYVGLHRTEQIVWNHAKIIAVDGARVMTGGHNMTPDYLKNPTYHDLSMVVEGGAAHQAHLYANRLWKELCEPSAAANPIVYTAATKEHSGVLLSNAGATCAPSYALQNGTAAAHGAASLPMIAVSRDSPGKFQMIQNLRGERPFVHPNDTQFAAMIDSAEKTLFISQKQLGPWLLSDESLAGHKSLITKITTETTFETKTLDMKGKEVLHHGIGGWPYLDQLARAVLRGVTVQIVIGNHNPNWTLTETAHKIGDRVKALYKATPDKFYKVKGGDVNAHLCEYLHIAPFMRGTVEAHKALGPIGKKALEEYSANHAKLIVVDREAFYVGSQNLYHSPLPEFGYFVDDPQATIKLLGGYWNHLWSFARKHKVTGAKMKRKCTFLMAPESLNCASLASGASDPEGAEDFLACVNKMLGKPAKAAGAAIGVDHNFGCTLKEGDVTDWPPRDWGGQNPAVRGKTKLWRPLNATGLGPRHASMCTRFPPATQIVKGAGKGGVTQADLVVVTEDLMVSRAFSKDKFPCSENNPAGKFGGWWSFTSPDNGTKDAYRNETGVCESWNDFTKIVRCTLKKGTVVAVGPTESYTGCAPGPNACPAQKPAWKTDYPASRRHQVFLNTYGRTPAQLDDLLTNCTEKDWGAPD